MHRRLVFCLVVCCVLVLMAASGRVWADEAAIPAANGVAATGLPSEKKDGAVSLLPPKTGWPEKPPVGNRRVMVTGLDRPEAYFLLSVPNNYTREQACPLVIVLHGGPGGRPDDLASVFRAGLAARGVISVYPQALDNQLLSWNYPHSGAYLNMILRQVAGQYRIDARRIYLVGHSMGGGGVWLNGAVMNELWAAIVPMSGWYQANPAPPIEWLKGMPVYCIHGADDQAVPVQRSRLAFAELQKLGSTTHTYAEFPDPKTLMAAKDLCVYREIQGAGHDFIHPWAEQGSREIGLMVAWLLTRQRQQPADLDVAERRLADWGRKFDWKPDGKTGVYAAGQPNATLPDANPPAPAAEDPASTTGEKKPKGATAADGPAGKTPQEKLQEYVRLHQQTAECFKGGKYEEAVGLCHQIIDLAPQRPDGYYNLGCAQARLGQTEEALGSLKKALECGYGEAAHMKADPDLESLRNDSRFEPLVRRAEENADSGAAYPYDKGGEMAGVKTIEGIAKGGFRYRLRLDPKATKDKPSRLIVWLHPSGGYANGAPEALVPLFFKSNFALIVFTQKNSLGWSEDDLTRVRKTLDELGTIEGLDAKRPILLGFSAGGQAALMMWVEKCADLGGLILDAAYPVDSQSYAAGQPRTIEVPADEAVKKTPLFVLVGDKDGGAQIWRKVHDPWLKAGVPLVVHYVLDKQHQWLFGDAQRVDLEKWLAEVAAGRCPADFPEVSPQTTPQKQ
jgi:predicted peptidase